MTIHELKTWPAFFWPVVHGDKTFELRKNDRDFQVGDVLVLREWDPVTEQYTGASSPGWHVTYVLAAEMSGWVLQPGYVVLGIGA